MKKTTKLKAIMLSLMLVAMMLPMTMFAQQKNEDFFRVDDEFNANRLPVGVIIGVMQNEDPTPLGSGLLIMTALGTGYVITRRKRNIKHGATLLIAAMMLFGMTQCKKNNIATISYDDTIFITLDASCGGGRTNFDPTVPCIKWSLGANEYISVGSSEKGYLGELLGIGDGSNAAENRLSFSGTITAPAGTEGEKLYFFYLGNGSHSGATSLDFSNQQFASMTNYVTDYLVAIGEGTITNVSGDTYSATADLEVKTAIARFNVSDMGSGNVYLRGMDVYSTATIDYTAGTITGNTKSRINMGTASSSKYIALIPSVSTETTLIFDSDTKAGGITFLRGIQANRYYSNDGNALVITGASALCSVALGTQVRFSPGNLQATYDGSSWSWDFAPNQWSYIGNAAGNTNVTNSSPWISAPGTVDLFGWSTYATYFGINSTYDDDTYYGDFVDWGTNAIGSDVAGSWRTLSKDEWQYLCESRTDKYGIGHVAGQYGYIILPDEFTDPMTNHGNQAFVAIAPIAFLSDNVYTTGGDWEAMEANGAVFLPAAGSRFGTGAGEVNSKGNYWSSSVSQFGGDNKDITHAYYIRFDEYIIGPIELTTTRRNDGNSVRLVR